MVAMETKVSHVIKLWTSFQKQNSGMLVQKEHGFQKGAQCVPRPQVLQKSLAWIGLNFTLHSAGLTW